MKLLDDWSQENFQKDFKDFFDNKLDESELTKLVTLCGTLDDLLFKGVFEHIQDLLNELSDLSKGDFGPSVGNYINFHTIIADRFSSILERTEE